MLACIGDTTQLLGAGTHLCVDRHLPGLGALAITYIFQTGILQTACSKHSALPQQRLACMEGHNLMLLC